MADVAAADSLPSVGEREWAVDGTPADCVIVALHKLLTEKVDLVISGINHGANWVRTRITRGPWERRAWRLCIVCRRWRCGCVEGGESEFSRRRRGWRGGGGINFERGRAGPGVAQCKCARAVEGWREVYAAIEEDTRNQLTEGKDPRGRIYFWLYEQKIDRDVEPDTDYAAIFEGSGGDAFAFGSYGYEVVKQLAHWGKALGNAFQG